MSTRLLSLYGLKFNPFLPAVPPEALFTAPAVDAFLRRVELGIADGGFAMVTGDPGTSKSRQCCSARYPRLLGSGNPQGLHRPAAQGSRLESRPGQELRSRSQRYAQC